MSAFPPLRPHGHAVLPVGEQEPHRDRSPWQAPKVCVLPSALRPLGMETLLFPRKGSIFSTKGFRKDASHFSMLWFPVLFPREQLIPFPAAALHLPPVCILAQPLDPLGLAL